MNHTEYLLEPDSYFMETISTWEEERCLVISINKMPGDASTRLYFRIHYNLSSERLKTTVLMKLPFPELHQELPFVNILNHLKYKGLPVPDLYYYDPSKGYLFLEDLADTTLADWNEERNYSEKKEMYKRVLDLLLSMQSNGKKEENNRCLAYQRAFDADRFLWELDFFLENMLFGLLKLDIPMKHLRLMREYFGYICDIISREPLCFTHRDYHSRNIMVKNDRLGLLDFQDARLGLCQYDLASVLMDSYTVLPENLIEELLDYYLRAKNKRESTATNDNKFRRIFYLTAIQRNLKAVGTFSSKMVQQKNDQYLQYISPTLGYVWRNLGRFPELTPLNEVLSHYLGHLGKGKEVDNLKAWY